MAHADAPPATATLHWSEGKLFRRGREHRLLAGSLHYFRVHPELWADRLRRLAALGVNTLDTYVAWNFHERAEGDFRFDGWQDIEHFLALAADEGLDVLLRPSPYICAEWSNGGIPFWLTGRLSSVRTSDPSYLDAVDRWYDVLLPRLVPLQASYGGPIVAVQVENEYGSFGDDRGYLTHLRDGLRSRGIVELLTTADGTLPDMIDNGEIDGALPTFTFGTGVDRAQALQRPGTPLICSELWGGWFDHWGERHHVRSADSMMGTVDSLLDAGGSLSLYMAHGGTNFGFWNGANYGVTIEPTITSYDSDAPIGEGGELGAKFFALREALAPFRNDPLPAVPTAPPVQPPQSTALRSQRSVADIARSLPQRGGVSPHPLSFEELGVEDGIVVYRTHIDAPAGATLEIKGLRDRAIVFIDGRRYGTLQRGGALRIAVTEGARSAELLLVVESLGRINYGPRTGERKGIVGSVLVDGRRFVTGWTHHPLPLGVPDVEAQGDGTATDGLAAATVAVADPADAWLAFPGGGKGIVWLNGFLLGRYWEVGPQETLYAPAPLWREGENEIVVFDTDRLGARVEVRERPSFGEAEEFIGS